jgi:hypothetical protein
LTYNKRHEYFLDGVKVGGVTTILSKAMPKGGLTQWAADCAADYAIEHWDELTGLPITKRVKAIQFAHRDVKTEAAGRGTSIHRYGEALIAGEPVEDPEYLGPAQAYARFADEWKLEPVATETPLCHTRFRYGGRADLWATIGVRDNALALVDLKAGKNVYAETVLQLAAYRHAEIWQPDGPDSEQQLPAVDLMYVAHIGADDVRMLPVDGCDPDPAICRQLRAFLYVQQTARWLDLHGWKGEEPLIGEAERP